MNDKAALLERLLDPLFALGCLMDPSGIVLLCVPLFLPIVKALGFDPLWFGVLFIVNLEMAYLTPPFGYNLFYLKSVVSEPPFQL